MLPSGMRPLLVQGWTVKWSSGQHRQWTDVSGCSQRPFVANIDLSWHNIEINRSARLSRGPVTPRPQRQLFRQLITCTYSMYYCHSYAQGLVAEGPLVNNIVPLNSKFIWKYSVCINEIIIQRKLHWQPLCILYKNNSGKFVNIH